jgi:hypothetical protein
MVGIDPQPQRCENGVTRINHTISVAAIRGQVIHSERREAVGIVGRWLRRRTASSTGVLRRRTLFQPDTQLTLVQIGEEDRIDGKTVFNIKRN